MTKTDYFDRAVVIIHLLENELISVSLVEQCTKVQTLFHATVCRSDPKDSGFIFSE